MIQFLACGTFSVTTESVYHFQEHKLSPVLRKKPQLVVEPFVTVKTSL